MTNAYDWLIQIDEDTTLRLLDAILATPQADRPPEANRLLEAIVQIWHGLYDTEILVASYDPFGREPTCFSRWMNADRTGVWLFDT